MNAQSAWPPAGWVEDHVSHGGHKHAFYVIDRRGPDAASILLMHEFPGISSNLVRFAEDLAEEFRVVVPSIVGRDGSPGLLGSFAQLCVRREVAALRTGRTSAAIPWLRELLDEHVSRGRPCGVIGMCMTGGFALALAVQPSVRAAVMAQPAMPISHLGKFPLPSADARAADLGLSPDTKTLLRKRLAGEPDAVCVRGYRFRDDNMSPPARLEAARDLLGDEAMTIVTLTEPDRAEHSTLTGDNRNRAAVLEVKAFLSERLAPPK